MFKPCPNCGFLVALIRGREASQRCPRCGSGLVEAAGDAADARGAASDAKPSTAGAASQPPATRESRAPTPDHAPAHIAPATPRQEDAADAPTRRTAAPQPDPAIRDATPDPGMRIDAAGSPAAEAPACVETDDGDAQPRGDRPADTPPEAAAPDAPAFARRRARPRPAGGRRWPLWAATAALALLLALQLLLAQREALARDAGWRPVVATTCAVLGCTLPPWREPAAFAMQARGVRPHPRQAGVLHVTTTLKNRAAWPQPLPVVVLSLSDIDGRIVGARAVQPRDYGRDAAALVAPGDSVDIAFDVREPAARVVSFDFQLR